MIDITDAREATDQGARQLATTSATFAVAWVYIALALSRISDADYLTGFGQTLPLIGVTVPTEVFVLTAPLLILVLHLAVLVQWLLFQHTAGVFEQSMSSVTEEERRQQFDLYPFVLTAWVVPARTDRSIRWPAAILIVAGMIIAPLFLLVATQVRTLAFHLPYLTMANRVTVFLDILAVWIYFPLSRLTRQKPRVLTGAIVVTAVLLWYLSIDAVIPNSDVRSLPKPFNLTDKLRERRLDLTGRNFNSTMETAVGSGGRLAPPGLDLQCKDLRYADLSHSTLVRPLLYGTNLRGARLIETRFLQSSIESNGTLAPRGHPSCANPNTSFAFTFASTADFTGQDLAQADFTGASLSGASFAGADLSNAKMEAVSLDNANLKAADLRGANLKLSSLIREDLRYALLAGADLSGADLRGALLYRNPVLLTAFHLADLTLASTVDLSEDELKALRESLTGAITSDSRRRAVLQRLDTLARASVSDTDLASLFQIQYAAALLIRYDFLPQDRGLMSPLAESDYATMLQAFVTKELLAYPELKDALANRWISEQLFLPPVLATGAGLRIGEPHNPSALAIRDAAVDPDFLQLTLPLGKTTFPTARFGPWANYDRIPTHGDRIRGVPWIDEFEGALSRLKPGAEATEKLVATLWKRAQSGDSLALAVLPRVIDLLPSASSKNVKAWLVTTAKSAAVNSTTMLAVSELLPAESADRKAILERAAQDSADAALLLASIENRAELLARSAHLGNLLAQEQLSLPIYFDLSKDATQRKNAWTALSQAAYRGESNAQAVVALAMDVVGDYSGARYWLRNAANSGDRLLMQNFARFLATCPDNRYVDPVEALDFAQAARRKWEEQNRAPPDPSKATTAAEDHAEVLDTLAAAYAASGDYEEASRIETLVIKTLPPGNGDLAARYAERLTTYQHGKRWLDELTVR
jgi:uncharacterized protein YjbI with pentapeptide repeats